MQEKGGFLMLLLLGWVSELARLASYLRSRICVSFIRVLAVRRGRFSSQESAFSVREQGREGTASCAGGRGRRFSCSPAAGRVLSDAGLASFHPDTRVPCSRASPRLEGRLWMCPYVVLLLRDSASSGAGAGGAGRLGSPGPGSLWGAPRGVPPPSQDSWCREIGRAHV